MTEKKFTYILISVAALAILVVILLNIPWGGDKAAISKEFAIDKDHIYETISEENLYTKINSGETFQLFVGYGTNPNGTPNLNGQSFAYEANKLATSYDVKIIYFLNYAKLTEAGISNLKDATSFHTEFPSLFYFEGDLNEASRANNISGLKELEDFDGSLLDLLEQYFKDCYENN